MEAKAAIDFINLSGFTPAEFQETFKTTVKTIQNYNRNELKLDAALSEKLLKSFIYLKKELLFLVLPETLAVGCVSLRLD